MRAISFVRQNFDLYATNPDWTVHHKKQHSTKLSLLLSLAIVTVSVLMKWDYLRHLWISTDELRLVSSTRSAIGKVVQNFVFGVSFEFRPNYPANGSFSISKNFYAFYVDNTLTPIGKDITRLATCPDGFPKQVQLCLRIQSNDYTMASSRPIFTIDAEYRSSVMIAAWFERVNMTTLFQKKRGDFYKWKINNNDSCIYMYRVQINEIILYDTLLVNQKPVSRNALSVLYPNAIYACFAGVTTQADRTFFGATNINSLTYYRYDLPSIVGALISQIQLFTAIFAVLFVNINLFNSKISIVRSLYYNLTLEDINMDWRFALKYVLWCLLATFGLKKWMIQHHWFQRQLVFHNILRLFKVTMSVENILYRAEVLKRLRQSQLGAGDQKAMELIRIKQKSCESQEIRNQANFRPVPRNSRKNIKSIAYQAVMSYGYNRPQQNHNKILNTQSSYGGESDSIIKPTTLALKGLRKQHQPWWLLQLIRQFDFNSTQVEFNSQKQDKTSCTSVLLTYALITGLLFFSFQLDSFNLQTQDSFQTISASTYEFTGGPIFIKLYPSYGLYEDESRYRNNITDKYYKAFFEYLDNQGKVLDIKPVVLRQDECDAIPVDIPTNVKKSNYCLAQWKSRADPGIWLRITIRAIGKGIPNTGWIIVLGNYLLNNQSPEDDFQLYRYPSSIPMSVELNVLSRPSMNSKGEIKASLDAEFRLHLVPNQLRLCFRFIPQILVHSRYVPSISDTISNIFNINMVFLIFLSQYIARPINARFALRAVLNRFQVDTFRSQSKTPRVKLDYVALLQRLQELEALYVKSPKDQEFSKQQLKYRLIHKDREKMYAQSRRISLKAKPVLARPVRKTKIILA